MKITKQQLRRIIRELNYLGGADDPDGIDAPTAEYNRGYLDAIDGFPPDLTAADGTYGSGYEAGLDDLQAAEIN